MAPQPRSLRRQRLSGYVLLVGALSIESLLVALVVFGTAPAVLPVFAGIPALIVGYFGARALLAARSGTVWLDEESTYPRRRAGQTAFWTLLAAIMMDDLFGLFPEEHLHASLIYVGVGTLFAALAYHKFLGTSPFPDVATDDGSDTVGTGEE